MASSMRSRGPCRGHLRPPPPHPLLPVPRPEASRCRRRPRAPAARSARILARSTSAWATNARAVRSSPDRALEPALWAELAQEPFCPLRREGRVPAIECDMGQPELGEGVELDLAEQRSRFLGPSLSPPELCLPDQGLERHAGPATSELLDSGLEGGVGLIPRAPPYEDRPVMSPADGEQILGSATAWQTRAFAGTTGTHGRDRARSRRR